MKPQTLAERHEAHLWNRLADQITNIEFKTGASVSRITRPSPNGYEVAWIVNLGTIISYEHSLARAIQMAIGQDPEPLRCQRCGDEPPLPGERYCRDCTRIFLAHDEKGEES